MLFLAQDYQALSRYLPMVREFLIPSVWGPSANAVAKALSSPTPDENDLALLGMALPLKLLGPSQHYLRMPLRNLVLLELSSTAVYIYHATVASISIPNAGSLPNLTQIIVDLNHPDVKGYHFRFWQSGPLEHLGSFVGAHLNHATIQLVGQIGAIATNLRMITVRGELDQHVIGELALISQLNSLDFLDAKPVGQGSLENFRVLAYMPHLNHLVLPSSLYTWSAGTFAPILLPFLSTLRIPEGTGRRCGGTGGRNRGTLDTAGQPLRARGHGRKMGVPIDPAAITRLKPSMRSGILTGFENPNVTDLHIEFDHLVDAREMMKGILACSSLQHLHVDVHRWAVSLSPEDILSELVRIPDLGSFAFFYHAGQWPCFMPTLGIKDAAVICKAWPSLHSLALGPVSFACFQKILHLLPELVELEVNAVCWEGNEWQAMPDSQHLGICHLIFVGRPEGWGDWYEDEDAPDTSFPEYFAPQFPNLQSMKILSFMSRGPEEDYWPVKIPDGVPAIYPVPTGSGCEIRYSRFLAKEIMHQVRELRRRRVPSK